MIINDRSGIKGSGEIFLYGPDGKLKAHRLFDNLVTDYGDQIYAQRAAGVAANAPTGMYLGVGTNAPAKNGSGSGIGNYLTNSSQAFDAGYPTAATKGAGVGWRVSYRVTWGTNQNLWQNITEVALGNVTPFVVAPAFANLPASFIARATFAALTKGQQDTMVVAWNHDFAGS